MDDKSDWWIDPQHHVEQLENTPHYIIEVMARWNVDCWEYAVVRWSHGHPALMGLFRYGMSYTNHMPENRGQEKKGEG